MEQKMLIDDIDGNLADGTWRFTYDGERREIDLTNANKALFDKDMEKWLRHSRVVGKSDKKAAADKVDLDVVREWARKNGYIVRNRGRIPKQVNDAYEAAQRQPVVAVG